jgi:hypothetical protein
MSRLLREISTRRSTSKGGTKMDYDTYRVFEESHKEYLKRLCKQTPL